jgi:hypothetical protein
MALEGLGLPGLGLQFSCNGHAVVVPRDGAALPTYVQVRPQPCVVLIPTWILPRRVLPTSQLHAFALLSCILRAPAAKTLPEPSLCVVECAAGAPSSLV